MIVAELIEELQGMDAYAEVHFHYCYGDHWRTEAAPPVTEVVVGHVKHSDYHRMDIVLQDEEEVYDEAQALADRIRRVVIIG
jgi:hypothetical protein